MVHRPKFVQSNLPYGGLQNTLVTSPVSDSCLITSEFWNDSPRPLWKIGTTITARKGYTWKTRWEVGKHFVVTTVYATDGNQIGSYWNICSPVQVSAAYFAYEDWYLDVWFPIVGTPQLLDDLELAEAIEKNYISLADADTAKWTAFRILELLRSD